MHVNAREDRHFQGRLDLKPRLLLPSPVGIESISPPHTANQFISTCRANGVTFGHAFVVLKQMAHAVMIHRHRHTMGAQEWNYRRQQPTHFDVPISLRGVLNPEWRQAGGATDVFYAAGPLRCTLPPMTVPMGDAPHASTFMPSTREFWARCRLVKKQTEKALAHSLLVELSEVSAKEVVDQLKVSSKTWRSSDGRRRRSVHALPEYPPGPELPATVLANVGSSFGDVSSHFNCYSQPC